MWAARMLNVLLFAHIFASAQLTRIIARTGAKNVAKIGIANRLLFTSDSLSHAKRDASIFGDNTEAKDAIGRKPGSVTGTLQRS